MNKSFILALIFIETIYSQCDIGEVEIWNACYPIDTTTILNNTNKVILSMQNTPGGHLRDIIIIY